ncbi:MAG: adenine phosphoribosyltransferase [Planctomycetaceae bacterium]|nr:adenine phosphoribosyltransferase [Planctomycetota bacterium]NUN53197.1 adenine phosphoribosyltransferase [Planctomycetaceae bacterium]
MDARELKTYIVEVPDFPKPGISFKDITPVLKSPAAYRFVIDRMHDEFKDRGVDLVLGVESRGFLFGAPLAVKLGKGFIPVRKPGKLPRERISASYALEYGVDALEVHRDAVRDGQKVVLVDDVLATGGTIAACAQLVRKLGGEVVGVAFLMELSFLSGRDKLEGEHVFSVVQY